MLPGSEIEVIPRQRDGSAPREQTHTKKGHWVPSHAFDNTNIFNQPWSAKCMQATDYFFKKWEFEGDIDLKREIQTLMSRVWYVKIDPSDLQKICSRLWFQVSITVCSTSTNKHPECSHHTSIRDCLALLFTLQPLMRTFYLSGPVCGKSLCCLYHLVIWQYQHDSQVMCLYANHILMKRASRWLQS